MTAKELKAQLRDERLSARDAIPAENRASKSLAMADHAGEAVGFALDTIVQGSIIFPIIKDSLEV